MNLDLDSGRQGAARPAEEGGLLEAKQVPKRFAPEFRHRTELEPGAELRANRLGDHAHEAEQDQAPGDLGGVQPGETERLMRRVAPNSPPKLPPKRADPPCLSGGGQSRNQNDRQGGDDRSEGLLHGFQ